MRVLWDLNVVYDVIKSVGAENLWSIVVDYTHTYLRVCLCVCYNVFEKFSYNNIFYLFSLMCFSCRPLIYKYSKKLSISYFIGTENFIYMHVNIRNSSKYSIQLIVKENSFKSSNYSHSDNVC